jgi:glycosyltransferase involved in cell wall biosynthesis
MRIGILGTRGIPNYYGGFEQFAELLSVYLVKKGHEVIVYNSKNHPYQESNFKGVQIVHCNDPEEKIGTIGQFIYDYRCVRDSRKRNFDIILQLGYTSSSVWSFLFPKESVIVTNMDGLEWKRSKYNALVQSFLRFAERLAVKKSDRLISDSIGIQNYLKKKYEVDSKYIAYGSEVFSNPNQKTLQKLDLQPESYNLLIARMEPENNVETIIKGVLKSNVKEPLMVIGDYNRTTYGKRLFEQYGSNEHVQFLGAIYDKELLNQIRYFSHIYFHGHSVGGTNPSLLEAMGCNTLIVANHNEFNKAILQEDAYYFDDSNDLAEIIQDLKKANEQDKIENNRKKIEENFSVEKINQQYESYFYECIPSR